MEKLFNRMLVPFHLWEDADTTIRQAIAMANQLQSDIYLLHIVKATTPLTVDEEDPLEKVMRLRYQRLLDPSLSLTVGNRMGAAEEAIIGVYRKFNIDLIFLCRQSPSLLSMSKPFFPVNLNRLLKKVKCPVLNIGTEGTISPLRHIVLPVGDHFPVRKLLFATYLARLSRSTIHLVSAEGHQVLGSVRPPGEGAESLHRSYRLLRENTDLPVECWTLPGHNLAETAWSYAKKTKADLILIQSGKESILSGSMATLFSRFLFNRSHIAVLTVP